MLVSGLKFDGYQVVRGSFCDDDNDWNHAGACLDSFFQLIPSWIMYLILLRCMFALLLNVIFSEFRSIFVCVFGPFYGKMYSSLLYFIVKTNELRSFSNSSTLHTRSLTLHNMFNRFG